MSGVIHRVKSRALDALLADLSPAERYALAARLLRELPREDRQRAIVNSPGFMPFATALLASIGRQRRVVG